MASNFVQISGTSGASFVIDNRETEFEVLNTGTIQANGDLNITTGGVVNIDAVTNITDTTSSISAATGAFVVAGGAGIGENLNVNGDIFSNNVTASNFYGDIAGNVSGDVIGNLTGNVMGNVTGDLAGNVTGNLTGNVTGNLTGNVTGNVTGNLTGNVTTSSITTSPANGDLTIDPNGTGRVVVNSELNVTTISTPLTNTNLTLAPSGSGIVTTANPVTITNSTASGSNITGALVVAGGIGSNNRISCNQLDVTGTAAVVSTIASTAAGGHCLTVRGNNVSTGTILRTANTAAMTTGTHILQDHGSAPSSSFDFIRSQASGSGVQFRVNGLGEVHTPTIRTVAADSNLTLAPDGTGITTTAKRLTVTNTTVSTNPSSGAFVVTGGAGIGDDLYIGGDLSATAGTSNFGDVVCAGDVLPSGNTLYNLGSGSFFWDVVYAASVVNPSAAVLKDYEPLTYGLDDLLKVKTIDFTWKKESENPGKRKHFGLIAENIKELRPDLVSGDSPETLSVNYIEMIPWLVKSIHDLNEKVEAMSLDPPPAKKRRRATKNKEPIVENEV